MEVALWRKQILTTRTTRQEGCSLFLAVQRRRLDRLITVPAAERTSRKQSRSRLRPRHRAGPCTRHT